jgi:hypothetical protein
MEDKVPFPAGAKAREVAQAMVRTVRDFHMQNVMKTLNPRNVQRMYHGVSWRTHSGDASAKEPSTMKQHQIEHVVKFEDVVAHRLEIIPLTIRSIVGGMQDQLMSQLYSTEKSGNVVNAGQVGSNTLAFLEMLKKIEFGVDEEGRVTLPELHLAPGNPLFEQLQKAGPEFEAEVDRVIQEKSAKALERERERISRFKA